MTDDVAKLLDQRGNFEGSRVPTEEEQASMVRAGCGGRPGDVKCRRSRRKGRRLAIRGLAKNVCTQKTRATIHPQWTWRVKLRSEPTCVLATGVKRLGNEMG